MDLLAAILPDIIPELKMRKSTSNSSERAVSERNITLDTEEDQADVMIPMMIRKYETGKLTPILIADDLSLIHI